MVCEFLLLVAISPRLLSPQKNGDWVLTFADEFNASELDLSRWAPHDPFTRDHQLQAYAPESLTVSGGQLHIVARRQGETGQYVSGIVSTFGIFAQTYGRFEIRCRVPAGRGLGPRFQLLPVPLAPLPAIDVFETTGSSPSKVFFANRWGTEQTERSFSDSFTGPDLSMGFHTLAVEWERDGIAWFIDGNQKFRAVDGIPHQPMYLLLELAVERNPARAPDAATTLPATFDIDYIRVYQRP
jgi:beta-glucanase (GH16 family)